MANVFDQFDTPSPGATDSSARGPASSNPFDQFDGQPVSEPLAESASSSPVYSGSIIPMTRYSDGTVGFDSNAGIVGMAKRALGSAYGAVTLPGDVLTGRVDPNSGEAIERSANLATLAAPDAALTSARAAVTPPTAQELKAAGSAGYDAVRNMGVDYSIPHVADMASQFQKGLNDKGITSRVAPDVHSILDDLQSPPSGAVSVPISLLDNARREFGQIAGNYTNKPQQGAAKAAQNAIDDFVTNPDPASVLSGPADDAAKTLAEARANFAAGARSDKINQRGDYAEYKANDSNSGQNLSNNLRKQASWFLDPLHPDRRAGFSPDEISALEDVNRGTPTRNAGRIVGNLLGGGLGMHGANTGVMGAVMGGEAAGVPGAVLGAATPLLGVAAKKVDQALTQRAFNKADEAVRQRSPLYREQANGAPIVTTAQPTKGIVARATASAVPGITDSDAPTMTPEEARLYIQNLQPGSTFKKGGAVKPRNDDASWDRMKHLVYSIPRSRSSRTR